MGATRGLAEKMAVLAELGFRSVDSDVIPAETVPVGNRRFKVTCSRPSMGTLVTITAIHESAGWVQETSGLAFREMERLVDLLNRYESASALSYLNTEGFLPDPPPELRAVLWHARFFHHTTGSAFDATVQPLVDLFRREIPSDSVVQETLGKVDGTRVDVGPRQVRLEIPGMGVTLDGIAKGFVVDRMAAVLEGRGLKDYLINAGGDIRCAGHREDGTTWRIGVQDPGKKADLPDIIGMSGGAVATSGSYEIHFDRDRTYHHIVSGETGLSPQASLSVSVVAPTALTADALATSLFVMEPDQGLALMDSFPECACFIVDRNGCYFRSQYWPGVTDPSTRRKG